MTDCRKPDGVRLQIDHTHLGRRATGIERITRELFSAAALSPLPSDCIEATAGRFGIAMAQNTTMPLRAMQRSNDVFVFSGFPPSPFFSLLRRDRTVMYVHDMFLLTRRSELNSAARYYFSPLFRLAVRNLKYFLVNSEYTGSTLREFCRPEATVMPCRPTVRNVFDLQVGDRAERNVAPSSLKAVAIGTIEPRKNLRAAAQICAALAGRLGIPVQLNVVGRAGWGDDSAWLSQQPNVTLHGALADEDVRTIVESSDFLICTSRDEGLGLPLLEVQHAGLPVLAPDQPVFREVLGNSGLLIDTAKAADAANAAAAIFAKEDWRAASTAKATANVARWNDLARHDQTNVFQFLDRLLKAAPSGASRG